ncbi:MAG TPA: bis(5'-nucleosyl)-tetraphosphatase (symmetrical) YqeK [Oscillospiraceae bacterium]|nr:bis(5'-nucleosyl)-tetraphosphatase (symmetrical) YqeK [Oscillospiraceae bacterium]
MEDLTNRINAAEYCALDTASVMELLRERLSERRLRHSLLVAERALALAPNYGADPGKAGFAGLVHDICKCAPSGEQLQTAKAGGIIFGNDAAASPALWHSAAGFVYLRDELGVTDEDILSAVRYHTSGRGGMSPLEKTIYMADLTSDDREYPGSVWLRKLAGEEPEQALAYSVRWIAGDLREKGLPVAKETEDLLEEYKDVTVARPQEERE